MPAYFRFLTLVSFHVFLQEMVSTLFDGFSLAEWLEYKVLDLQFAALNSSPALTAIARFHLSSREFKSLAKLGLPPAS